MNAIALDIKPLLTGWDHAGPLTVLVSGVPAGASLSAGACCFDGCWELGPDDLDGLCITPPAHCAAAALHLVVRAISTEIFNGSEVEGVQTLRMRVELPRRESLDFTQPGLRWDLGGLELTTNH